MWRGVALWFSLALVVRTLTAAVVTHPGYIDATYSFHVASNLLAGRGLVEDVLWNYLSPPFDLPRPSNAYWPPGTALLAAAGSRLLPEDVPLWRRMQVAPVLGAALVVAGAYAMARSAAPASGRRAVAVAGMTLFSGIYFPYWVTTDGFTPFAVVGGAVLWMATTGARSWRLFAAGLLAGFAQGIRADGLLLLVAPVSVAVMSRRRLSGTLLAGLAATLAGGLCGAFPLLLRNWMTWGAITPPGAAGAVWLREYDDLFLYSELPTWERWRAAGGGAALLARAGALWGNLGVLGQPVLYYAAPLTLLGLWRTRGWITTRVPLAYVLSLYAVMSLVFPLPGVRGGLFHSLIACLPWVYLWTVLGLETVVAWGARRRRWPERQAQTVFAGALVAYGALASITFATQLTARWDRRLAAYVAAAAWLEVNAPADARVMAVDPPGFWYASGRRTVVTPSDGLAGLIAAAGALDVDYVLVEPAVPAYLAPASGGEAPVSDLELLATVGPIRIYRVAPAVPGWARHRVIDAVSAAGSAWSSSAADFRRRG